MKTFAFFLPQFHEIPENNEWWGEEFTEWTNVKKAKPLFHGHKQPIHPLNGNYYDLTLRDTVLWQTELMHKYGIDGLCYYHYYFDGKLLLEKPAENLLADKSIDQPFFFCWANHTWRRSWNGQSTVLIQQTYGTRESWERHFQYLLPFFKDDRYEKKDNKPLFMLFAPSFKEKNEMMAYFNNRCIQEGFDGIAVIESFESVRYEHLDDAMNNPCPQTSYFFLREPGIGKDIFDRRYRFFLLFDRARSFAKKRFNIGRYVRTYSGDKLLNASLSYVCPPCTIPVLRGLSFEWDNTARHQYRGYIINPISHKTFLHFMEANKNQEYLFINAWNEWCEGMILEPTEENGFKYLEWIKEWKDKS